MSSIMTIKYLVPLVALMLIIKSISLCNAAEVVSVACTSLDCSESRSLQGSSAIQNHKMIALKKRSPSELSSSSSLASMDLLNKIMTASEMDNSMPDSKKLKRRDEQVLRQLIKLAKSIDEQQSTNFNIGSSKYSSRTQKRKVNMSEDGGESVLRNSVESNNLLQERVVEPLDQSSPERRPMGSQRQPQDQQQHNRRILNDAFGILSKSVFSSNNHLGQKEVPKWGSEEEY